MKIIALVLLTFAFFPFSAKAQEPASVTDSTRAIFENIKYSYTQFDIGYCGIRAKGEMLNGMNFNFAGWVYNEKWATSFGADMASNYAKLGHPESPKKVSSYISLHWNNEYLVRPRSLVNFSFPFRVAWVNAITNDTIAPYNTGAFMYGNKIYFQHADNFFTFSPGVNVFLNVFRTISIGAGANYRFALGVDKIVGSNADFSDYSLLAFLRIKFDTRAWTKRMYQRQKEYMKQLESEGKDK